MSRLDPLLERNRTFASSDAHEPMALASVPNLPLFLITCLDPRTDPANFLGLRLGDAVVVRNAGGRVTDAVIDDVALISFMAGMTRPDGPLFEVAVVHHNECGTAFLANGGFRHGLAQRTGRDEAELGAVAVTDPAATVRIDVDRLLASPAISPRITVSGHLYDVNTGLLSTVIAPTSPKASAMAGA